jgi:hypothetical protein
MRLKSALYCLFPATFFLLPGAGSATICGDAYYNHTINWPQTSDLYFTVAGAPASTCGDLYVSRNGSAYQKTAGWICTDGAGTATKGPWTYASQTGDETAYGYIDWGTCTSPTVEHIWDVSNPTATVSSSAPSNFYGSASDNTWGAGFDSSWTFCYGEYADVTTPTTTWWNGSGYSGTSQTLWTITCSGMPSHSISWSTTSAQRPALSDHQSGHHYLWTVWIWDGGHWGTASTSFWY